MKTVIAIVLLSAGVIYGAPERTALEGTQWRLVNLEEKTPLAASTATLTLNADRKRISGSTGCNRLTGGYTASGQSLRFTPVGLTRMACPEPLMRQEQLFSDALRATRSYRITGGKLELLDDGRTLATFTKQDASPPTDKWLGKWIGPEGTSLVLSKNGNGYGVRIRSLDGVETFKGEPRGDGISFKRNGETESIRAGAGKATGMKWLLNKKNCLIIRTGEGFCRE